MGGQRCALLTLRVGSHALTEHDMLGAHALPFAENPSYDSFLLDVPLLELRIERCLWQQRQQRPSD